MLPLPFHYANPWRQFITIPHYYSLVIFLGSRGNSGASNPLVLFWALFPFLPSLPLSPPFRSYIRISQSEWCQNNKIRVIKEKAQIVLTVNPSHSLASPFSQSGLLTLHGWGPAVPEGTFLLCHLIPKGKPVQLNWPCLPGFRRGSKLHLHRN